MKLNCWGKLVMHVNVVNVVCRGDIEHRLCLPLS